MVLASWISPFLLQLYQLISAMHYVGFRPNSTKPKGVCDHHRDDGSSISFPVLWDAYYCSPHWTSRHEKGNLLCDTKDKNSVMGLRASGVLVRRLWFSPSLNERRSHTS